MSAMLWNLLPVPDCITVHAQMTKEGKVSPSHVSCLDSAPDLGNSDSRSRAPRAAVWQRWKMSNWQQMKTGKINCIQEIKKFFPCVSQRWLLSTSSSCGALMHAVCSLSAGSSFSGNVEYVGWTDNRTTLSTKTALGGPLLPLDWHLNCLLPQIPAACTSEVLSLLSVVVWLSNPRISSLDVSQRMDSVLSCELWNHKSSVSDGENLF